MSNTLGININDRICVLREAVMQQQFRDLKSRLVLVEGGFGAEPGTIGTAIICHFLCDGEVSRWGGYDIERLATYDDLVDTGMASVCDIAIPRLRLRYNRFDVPITFRICHLKTASGQLATIEQLDRDGTVYQTYPDIEAGTDIEREVAIQEALDAAMAQL